MSVKYVKIGISIHGLDIEEEAAFNFLIGWLRESTIAALCGDSAHLFKFKNEVENDLEVEIEESAGGLEK